MKQLLKTIFIRHGYKLVASDRNLPDITEDEKAIDKKVLPYTMTSIERVVTLIRAVKYIVKNRIAGDFTECGVWKGGSMMAAAYTLIEIGDITRNLFLYDTFTGMSPPTNKDKAGGTPAEILLAKSKKGEGYWCESGVDEVRRNLTSTGYPLNRIHLIKGKVEETIPGTLPGKIALLRLDTDWYESTLHELRHLYPLLVKGGVLIIDDYGHWEGAKEATDEYFNEIGYMPFLNRIDYTGRLIIKP